MKIKEIISEAFDQPYKGKWEKSDYGDVDLNVKLPDGTPLSIMFNVEHFNPEYDGESKEVVQVEFYRNNSQDVTGEGDAQRIFATVLDAIQKYIKKYKPEQLSFSASKSLDMDADDVERFNPESRAKLYTRLVQRYAGVLGYQAQVDDNGDVVIYQLTRLKQGVAEGTGGIDFDMHFDDETGSFAKLTARAHGRVLGFVKFFVDGDTLIADKLEVDERYRGQGIAAAMYDYAKSQGYTVEKSDDLTPDGEHFWSKNRGDRSVWENFADGRHPEDKGDSKRHHVPTKASVSSLRKFAKNHSGRAAQLAHWMANMKSGRAKKK
jgi:GNAT superfamily N-acetyltransferase